jgi:uncharacterized protein (TIGR04141 family)
MKASLYLLKSDIQIDLRYSLQKDGSIVENDKSAFGRAVCLFGETAIENYIRNKKLEPKRIRKATSKFDVYFRNVRQHAPEWAQFWDISESVFQRSADCIVFLEIKKQKYAICHGRSYGLLNASAITRNFGLITALNAIDPSAIICADTFTPSDIGIQKRIRTGRGTRIRNYEINVFNSLLKTVSGRAKKEYKDIITIIEGADSFKLNVKDSPVSIQLIIEQIYAIYSLEDYKKGDFGWVDNFAIIKDQARIADLDNRLVSLLNAQDASVIFAIPNSLDYSGTFNFKIEGFKKRKHSIHQTMNVKKIVYEEMTIHGYQFSDTKSLDNIEITIVDYDDPKREIDSFPLHSCIYTEIKDKDQWYFIESGIWYKVKPQFSKELEATYEDARRTALSYPVTYSKTTLKKKYNNPKAKKDRFENWFNQELVNYFLSQGHRAQCLDADNIQMSGYDKIEVCDVICSHGNKRYYFHNKYNYGSSALSHLFSQGNVASELLMSPEFRKKVNLKIGDAQLKLEEDGAFDSRRETIVFGIISQKDATGSYSIPLFSKINFRMFYNNIKTKNYEVKLCFFDEI